MAVAGSTSCSTRGSWMKTSTSMSLSSAAPCAILLHAESSASSRIRYAQADLDDTLVPQRPLDQGHPPTPCRNACSARCRSQPTTAAPRRQSCACSHKPGAKAKPCDSCRDRRKSCSYLRYLQLQAWFRNTWSWTKENPKPKPTMTYVPEKQRIELTCSRHGLHRTFDKR